jgi:hypothetical protein
LLTSIVRAPWDGKFTLHVKFNGKWGSKKNSFIVNDGTPVSTVPGSANLPAHAVSVMRERPEETVFSDG